MKMPKAKIEISLTGKQTREIALSTIGRSSDKPLRTIAFMGLDNRWHFFGKMTKICYSRTQQKTNTKSF